MVKKKSKDNFKLPPELKNKPFWVLLIVFLTLSVVTILISVENSNVTGNIVQTIGFMKGGQELNFEIKEIPGIKEITVLFNEDVKNGKIFFEEDSNITFNHKYYSKFTISSTEDEKYGDLIFLLKIKETDLLENGISIYDLRLYANGQELTTTLTKNDGVYVFYQVTSKEMGEFVIGKVVSLAVKEESEEESKEESEEESVNSEETLVKEVLKPIIEESVEQSEEKEGFFTKIANFFKNLFN